MDAYRRWRRRRKCRHHHTAMAWIYVPLLGIKLLQLCMACGTKRKP